MDFEVSSDLNRIAVEAAQSANPAVRTELIDVLLAKLGERIELTAEQINIMRNDMVQIGGYAEPMIVIVTEDDTADCGRLQFRLNVWEDGICRRAPGLGVGDKFTTVSEMIETLSREIGAMVEGVPFFFNRQTNPPFGLTLFEACALARAGMNANAIFVLDLLKQQGLSDDLAKAMYAALYLELEQIEAGTDNDSMLHELAQELRLTGGGLKQVDEAGSG